MSKPYYEALPSALFPEHYDVSVYDIDLASDSFKGSVSIDLSVHESTDEVHLNYRDLKIDQDSIKIESDAAVDVAGYTEFEAKHFFVVKLSAALAEGSTARITVNFSGVIQTNMAGFYKSTYTEDGATKTMLSTQFEAIDARRAFPCFDEPGIKSTFTIDITARSDWTVLSNMPEASSEDVDGGLKKVVFQKSPKMSVYLVAYALGEFEYVETFTQGKYVDDKPLPIRIYTTKDYIKDATFALNITPTIIDYFSKIFEIKFPLPKLDLIAVHSYVNNGMENWGLVSYRTTALLFDEAKSDPSYKSKVCYVVAHEMAHQWFGDLVTMKWWDELWLNEGFATWVGFLAVDYLKPEWDRFTSFVSESLQLALNLDGLRNSHPIHVPVLDAMDVDQLFDAISYQKGASVILMLSNYLGTEVFLKGVADYLKKFQFSNATTTDLWNSISQVSGKPVNKMMENWTGRIGFPVVNVEFHNKDLVLSQARFLNSGDVTDAEDETTWWIPLNISTGSEESDVAEGLAIDSFDSKKVIVENFAYADAFFKLNKNTKGVYRVNYSPKVLNNNILPNFSKLTAKDKVGIIADIAAVAISGHEWTSTITLLDVLTSVIDQLGDDYTVWWDLGKVLSKFQTVFGSDPKLAEPVNKFITTIYSGISLRLLDELKANDNKIPSADFLKVNLIVEIFNKAGGLLIPQFVAFAKEKFDAWKKGTPIDPSWVLFVFTTICSQPDLSREDFDLIVKEVTNPSSLDSRENALKALGCLSNLDLLDTLLGYLADTTVIPAMDSHFLGESLAQNTKTKDLFWAFFKENYETFYGFMSKNAVVIERFVRLTLSKFSTSEKYNEINSFFKTKTIQGFDRSLNQALDNVKTNAAWYERDQEKVDQWLAKSSYRGRSRTENIVELTSVPVSFFGSWDVAAPFWLRVGEFLVGNSSFSGILQAVDPRVSNTIGELLLLSPQDLVWQVRLDVRLVGGVESLSQGVFLDLTFRRLDQFVLWVNVHTDLQELLVQERNSGFQSPSHGRLVGSQTVGVVQVLDSLDTLLVEFIGRWSVGKVQVSTEDFIGTLTRENHLDTLGLNLSGQQVHRSRGSDGGDVVGLQVGDDIV